MTRLTGWCATDLPHPRDHQTCQERQDDGRLGECSCGAHGGHTSKEDA